MFADLFRRLSGADTDPAPTEFDQRLAMAALLVRIARADGAYDAEEITRIDRVLAQRFGLQPVEAAALRTQAEGVEAEAPDTVRFTRAIKDSVPYEARAQVVECLWEVVLADGERDAEEDALLRLVAPMLGINDRDSALARRRVMDRRG